MGSHTTGIKALPRRQFLTMAVAAAGTALAAPAITGKALAATGERRLRFYNLHTGEEVSSIFRIGGNLVPDGLAEINHVLRDFRTGEVEEIDPRLLDMLHALRGRMDSKEAFHVISGYRSPKTNSMLRKTGGGGVAKKSFHMKGMAIDVRLPGRDLDRLHRAAIDLKSGGVGKYSKSNFIHVDVGPVRYW